MACLADLNSKRRSYLQSKEQSLVFHRFPIWSLQVWLITTLSSKCLISIFKQKKLTYTGGTVRAKKLAWKSLALSGLFRAKWFGPNCTTGVVLFAVIQRVCTRNLSFNLSKRLISTGSLTIDITAEFATIWSADFRQIQSLETISITTLAGIGITFTLLVVTEFEFASRHLGRIHSRPVLCRLSIHMFLNQKFWYQ